MRGSGRARFVVAYLAVVAATIAGCELANLVGPVIPPGGRLLIIQVENNSSRPALIVVARDLGVAGPLVGTANPGSIPPGGTVDVRIGIPPGSDWAIYVNPGPQTGPLVTAHDIPPAATGQMPFRIGIDATGQPYSEFPGAARPGWFGN